MSLKQCEDLYPDILEILKKRFFEEGRGAPKRENWWQFHRHRSVIYKAMKNLTKVLLRPYTSNMSWFEFGETNWVYSNAVVIVLSDKDYMWGILNSSIHEEHTMVFATRMKTDLRYIPSACFRYFPLPRESSSVSIAKAVKEYQPKRLYFMNKYNICLRELYQSFHNAEEAKSFIRELRDLHVEMNKAVAIAYDWTDLDLGHGFHKTRQGIRFTISEIARNEILKRLLELNHDRHAEEVHHGLQK